MQLWCNLKPPWSWGVREPSLGGDSLWIFERASPDWQWEWKFLAEKSIVIVVDFVWNCTKKTFKSLQYQGGQKSVQQYLSTYIYSSLSSMHNKSALHERNMAPMYWLSCALNKPAFLQALPYILEPGVLFSTTPARTTAKKDSYHACHSPQPRLPPPMRVRWLIPSMLLHEFPSPTPQKKENISSSMWKSMGFTSLNETTFNIPQPQRFIVFHQGKLTEARELVASFPPSRLQPGWRGWDDADAACIWRAPDQFREGEVFFEEAKIPQDTLKPKIKKWPAGIQEASGKKL